MTEERNIEQFASKANPFRTPEGYFEGLTDQIMAKLPKEDANKSRKALTVEVNKKDTIKGRKKSISLRVWRIAAAAVFAGLIAVGTTIYIEKNQKPDTEVQTSYTDNTQYMDEALDYALVNNDEIADYLTDSE